MAKNKNLGKTAVDKITGFTGTVTGAVQYITGCDQYLVTPACNDHDKGKYPEGQWIDENRLNFKRTMKQVQWKQHQSNNNIQSHRGALSICFNNLV
jgi:hypothetical protein